MAWILLFVAGVFEVVWAYYMKQSSGFTRLVPTLITVATMIVSFFAVLGEPANTLRVVAAALIVGGLVLMRLSSTQ
jgi:quaternary ammonium compound-resistance protein SugE